MIIPRIYDNLEKLLKPGKVVVIYGPRRVGKTTLLKRFVKETGLAYRFDRGDDVGIQKIISSRDTQQLKGYVGGYDLIIIDEAQLIPNIGLGLKLIVDTFPKLMVLVTGSASLSLSYKIGEPLVGRQLIYNLHPLSQFELAQSMNSYDLEQSKESYLVYGSYPQVLTSDSLKEKQQVLSEIAHSYLLKDILMLERIKGSKVLLNLLKLVAFQVGSEVSLTELGGQLGMDRKTVWRYLDLLEKVFVLYNLPSYHINQRKAISKKSKYYFWDNGIRNAIINNFNPLDTRNDVGQLWENFLISERLKKQSYLPIYSGNYFWRTWDKKEVDWVEMRDGKLFGFEFKWRGVDSKNKSAWLKSAQDTKFFLVNQENYLDFVSGSAKNFTKQQN